MKPAPVISHQQAVIIDGLDLGLRTQLAQLFQVLCTDPTGIARFKLGLERAVSIYELTVAIALENSATGGDGTPTRGVRPR